MASTNLPLDADRLWGDVMALAEITDPERPYTRRSFSPLFLEGRAWLAKRFADAGLAVRIDTAGNLIGRLEGKDSSLGVIAVGSHSDTVPSGGASTGLRAWRRASRSCGRFVTPACGLVTRSRSSISSQKSRANMACHASAAAAWWVRSMPGCSS